MKELKKITKDLTILYIEDEEDIRTQFAITLQTLFKDVHIACNGSQGFAIYKEHADKIDLVATDIHMPVMNGLDMSKNIKALNRDAHIIIISAYSDIEYFLKAIEIGVDGFMVKPVQSVQLKNVIYKSVQNLKLKKEHKLYKEQLEDIVKQKTRELEELYAHDKLTGCLNRQKLDEALSKNEFSSLMLVNIDNLDSINSTYGYTTGDETLKAFANFLRELIYSNSQLFRLAGDEFVIICEKNCQYDKEIMAAKIIDKLQDTTFRIGEFSIHLSCTIGITDKNDKDSSESALVRAHAAMKEMREIGKNRFNTYTNDSPYIKKQKSNIDWMLKVREALANDSIIPYYQPIIHNETMQIVKYECLARLLDADTVISPYFFIEPARIAGLLPKITEVMFVKSFAYFQNKIDEFSLNITEDDLKASYLPLLLKGLIEKYKIAPQRVTLEILEIYRRMVVRVH